MRGSHENEDSFSDHGTVKEQHCGLLMCSTGFHEHDEVVVAQLRNNVLDAFTQGVPVTDPRAVAAAAAMPPALEAAPRPIVEDDSTAAEVSMLESARYIVVSVVTIDAVSIPLATQTLATPDVEAIPRPLPLVVRLWLVTLLHEMYSNDDVTVAAANEEPQAELTAPTAELEPTLLAAPPPKLVLRDTASLQPTHNVVLLTLTTAMAPFPDEAVVALATPDDDPNAPPLDRLVPRLSAKLEACAHRSTKNAER
jgi:hypothetical protein